MPSADIHILAGRGDSGLPPEVVTRLERLFQFLGCRSAARAKIQSAAQFIPLKPDEPIFYAGELHGVVWWVLAGEVGFYRGTQHLFSVEANDVLAQRPLELQVPFRYSVTASTEVWVMRLPLMIFEQCQQDGQVVAAALRDSVSDVVAAYLETRDAPALERLLIGPLFFGLKPAAAQRLIQRLPAEPFAANRVCEIGGRVGMPPDLMLLESGALTLTLFGPDAGAQDHADAPATERLLMQTDLHAGDMVPAPALAGSPGYRITLTWLAAGCLRKLDCAEFIASHCARLLPEIDVEQATAALAADNATVLSLHDARSATRFEIGQRETISLADLPGASRRLTPRRRYIIVADAESEALFAGLYLLGRGLRVQLLERPSVVQAESDASVWNAGGVRSNPANEGDVPNQGTRTPGEVAQATATHTPATQGVVNEAPGAAADCLETLIARFQADLRAQLALEARRERDRLAQAWARALTRVQKEADARVQARLSALERNERSILRAAEARLAAQHRELDALRKILDAERAEVASVRRIFEEKLAAATALQAEVLAMRNRLTGQLHDLWPPTHPRGGA